MTPLLPKATNRQCIKLPTRGRKRAKVLESANGTRFAFLTAARRKFHSNDHIRSNGEYMLGVSGYYKKRDLKASIGKTLRFVETSLFGSEYKPDGVNVVVGPDAYRKREWYAQVTCSNGIITKVK